jgi:hypothetical protein
VVLCLGGHGALIFESLDMSVLDMAFYPIPVKVLGNLLFFGFSSVILFFFLGSAIHFFFCSLLCGQSHNFLLCFGRDVLWIRIRRLRMWALSRLLQRRILLLSFGRMAGRRSGGSWRRIRVESRYGICSVLG